MPLRPTAPAAAAPTGPASRPSLPHFIVLCLAMGAALHAEPLVAAAELHLHPSVVVCVVLAVAALFHWGTLSLNFLVARRRPAEAEPRTVLGPAAPAATAPMGSVSRSALLPFIAICLAMGAALHAEPLAAAAAAELQLHPGIVVCVVLAVAALFHWSTLSLNYLVAGRRPAERRPNELLRATNPAACAFLVLAALVSASWFVEPFAAAAELRLPRAAAAATVLLFAALFNVSVSLFHALFVPRPPPAGAAARRGRVRAISVAVMSAGTAACLVAAGGSAFAYVEAASS